MNYFGAISSVNALISNTLTQPKGDLAGRLNSRITVVILSISAALLLSTHFWGNSIMCWTPAEFPPAWINFVNQFCYVEGTYFYSLKTQLDYNEDERQKHFIDYYQWVPYVLALQAFFFYMPHFVLNLLSSYSGYDLSGSIQYVDKIWHGIQASNFAARQQILEQQVAIFLWDGIKLSRRRNRGKMIVHYVIYTIVQTLNAFAMFWWLNDLIDSPLYSFSGVSVIADILRGLYWQETGHFPRITHCDVPRRMLANSPKQTVNCVLTLNTYYEKLLIFLWFWMLFVCVVSALNCMDWLRTMYRPRRSQQGLRAYLNMHIKSVHLNKFLGDLGPDGVFIMQQIALNIGDLPASYVALAMYNVNIGSYYAYHQNLIERRDVEEV